MGLLISDIHFSELETLDKLNIGEQKILAYVCHLAMVEEQEDLYIDTITRITHLGYYLVVEWLLLYSFFLP